MSEIACPPEHRPTERRVENIILTIHCHGPRIPGPGGHEGIRRLPEQFRLDAATVVLHLQDDAPPLVQIARDGRGDQVARLEALEAGVNDIIAKPFDIEELRLRVEAAIRLSTIRMEAY